VLAADRLQLLRNFKKKQAAGEVDPYGDLVEGVHPDWLEVSGCPFPVGWDAGDGLSCWMLAAGCWVLSQLASPLN